MRMVVAVLACVIPFSLSAPPLAQTRYPERPIKMIVPYAPGGAADFLARVVGDKLGERLKQPIYIENMGGAGSNRGVAALAKSPNDGYTIGTISAASHSINPALYKDKLPFRPLEDFAFLSPMGITPNVLVVNPDKVPAKTVPEFIAFAKAHSGKLNYGSSGYGTTLHVGMELFKNRTGTEIAHVPFQGSGPLLGALLAGTVDVVMDGASVVWPTIEAGKLRLIAVTTAERAAFSPQTPTVGETLPGFEIVSWHGVAAPAGTPQPILDTLAAALREVIASPEVQARFRQQAAIPYALSPEAFREFVMTQMKRWEPLVEQSGATLQ